MRRLITCALVAVAAVGCAGGGGPVRARTVRPNVIVIMTDDQTLESLRVMRNVKRLLAAEGTTFDSSFVSFSLCCPSRSTFLTGQYAHNHGVIGNAVRNGGYYALDHTNTLPVWLRRSGYYTALVGKYLNLYGTRNPREIPPGWNEWFATVDPTTYDYLNYTINDNGVVERHTDATQDYMTDVLARKAVSVIHKRARHAQPFFLWLAFVAPHAGEPRDRDDKPLDLPRSLAWAGSPSPPERYRNRFDDVSLPRTRAFNEADLSDKPAFIRSLPLLPAHSRAAIRESYEQQLESLLPVDDAVARIVNELSAAGALDRTVIVFTSDNGYFNGEHRIPTSKIYAYEPSIRVPLVMRGPGIPRGAHRAQMVANVDLAPTIADLARARPRRTEDGVSLMSIVRDPSVGWGRDLVLERGPEGWGPTFVGLRTPRFKYVRYRTGEEELYDLARDPAELSNRSRDRAYAGLEATLRRRLDRLRRCAGRTCRRTPDLRVAFSFARGDGGCARSPIHVSASGSETRWVDYGVVFVNGRQAVRRGRLRSYAIPDALRGSRVRLRVELVLRDGRRVVARRALATCD